MYKNPAERGMCIVSMYIFAKSGAGVATIRGITIWCVCRVWHMWHILMYQAMSCPMYGHQ